jgi:ferredoxin
MLYIDPTECIDCGACEPACPVSAISAEEDVPVSESQFVALNADWFSDKEAVRARVEALRPAD